MNKSLLTDEKNSKIISAVNFISSKYLKILSSNYDLPNNFSKRVANTNSKQHVLLISWDKEKPWIQILR